MPKKPFARTTIAAQAPSNAVGEKKHGLAMRNDGLKWPNRPGFWPAGTELARNGVDLAQSGRFGHRVRAKRLPAATWETGPLWPKSSSGGLKSGTLRELNHGRGNRYHHQNCGNGINILAVIEQRYGRRK